ncbi:MAG: M20/M25/M40 family metallo-hydrolase [Oscillospiraceae bacterium]|nr:M20/M25/M40 family metallo-hydrolase [Oscillospiraceae bacterium]
MKETIEKAMALRKKLHAVPEPSGEETKTKAALIGFLKEESDLEIVDCGKWFYAAHRESGGESLALRADMDAVPGADGRAFHGCGHDGHMAVMAALAAATSGKRLGKSLFFLFQHAEETGAGGAECCELFDREKIGAIFGFHNCPGFEAGHILLLPDTFACASRGLILSFQGSQSHAAYPENGRNPVFPMAEFFSHWGELTDPAQYRGLVLATPVGLQAGGRSFGVAAGSGEIDLTLRAWYDGDLNALTAKVTGLAGELAEKAGVSLSLQEQDVFPATHNAPALYSAAERAAGQAGLTVETPPEPFRWSEDFGHYARRCPAFFLGVGGGKDAAGLHTPEYQWNDAVTEAALRFFSALVGI